MTFTFPQATEQGYQQLKVLLASTHVLYVKTLFAHWNVRDHRFLSLHQMFQSQYETLATAVDDIAERIRIMGKMAPGSLREFIELSQCTEFKQHHYSADELIQELAHDHEKAALFLREGIAIAEASKDYGLVDFFSELLRIHEKTSWFLRSHIIK